MDHQKTPTREPGMNDSLLYGDGRVVACLLLTTVENVRAIRSHHNGGPSAPRRDIRALRRCAIDVLSREESPYPWQADAVWLRSACRELALYVDDLFETPWQASGAGG